MKKITLIISLSLLFSSCSWVEKFSSKEEEEIEQYRAPKSVKINKDVLFTESLRVKNFYKENEYFTVWTEEQNRKDFLDGISNLEQEGIDLMKYDMAKMAMYHAKYENLNLYEKIQADIVFTDSFLKITKNLVHGKVNPNKYYSDWVAPLKEVNFNQLLLEALTDKNIDEALKQQIPSNAYYLGIKEAIASYQTLPKDTLLSLKATDHSKIKKKLNYWNDGSFSSFDSSWDEEAKDALKHFQKRHGLYPSGNITEETLTQLNVSKDYRLKQLRVNLERARWFYKELGENYVLVNLPEFKLFLYENGSLVETHDVIIGKQERATPILSSTFNNLVINPTWTVPPTILKNDLVPKASANRSYFVNNKITIFDKKGKVVSPGSWDSENFKNYRYVQKPGGSNSLGLIKFNFPNDHMVYLHDTNNRTMFEHKKRDLSSGCVRVKDPFDLATRILEIEGSDYDREKLDTLVARGETKTIPLKKKVNVHQLYWTAWKNDQGVQFRNDIYSLDDGLYKKLVN